MTLAPLNLTVPCSVKLEPHGETHKIVYKSFFFVLSIRSFYLQYHFFFLFCKICVCFWCMFSWFRLCIHFDLVTNDWVKYLIHFRMMATNYIGAFCLTKLLLPLLSNSPVPSRIMNVSSFTHRSGKLVLGYACQPFLSE